MNKIFSNREKAILIGLYLSRFDEDGLAALDFDGFKQAFNTLGLTIGIKPSSIKNYRDEFDPYFQNSRKGWHKRAIRDYCKKFLEEYTVYNFSSFTDIIKGFVIDDYEIEKMIAKIDKKEISESVAKRLITGKAAEEYFKKNYSKINIFEDYELKDTTNLACGFDFKLSYNSDFFCVEVKGLNANSGSLSLTEKEFHIAREFKKQYCLFVVMNFIESPNHQILFDPINSRLNFKKIEKTVKQVNYTTSL